MEINDFNRLISQNRIIPILNFAQQDENSTAQSVAILVLKLFS